MDRKLALWIGVPFLGVAWLLIGVVALAPGLVNSRLLMLLLLALSVMGILILGIRIAVRGRANSPLLDTLYPVAGILVAIGIGFHEDVGAFARGIFDYATQDNPATDGMRFVRAEDGQFHVTLMVEGSAVDFRVDPGASFNALMPDVPKRIGINPSVLIYDQRLSIAQRDTEYAAEAVLPTVQLGGATIVNLPVKVLATDRWGHNILGKPFFDNLQHWRISGDSLIIVP